MKKSARSELSQGANMANQVTSKRGSAIDLGVTMWRMISVVGNARIGCSFLLVNSKGQRPFLRIQQIVHLDTIDVIDCPRPEGEIHFQLLASKYRSFKLGAAV